MNDYVYISVKLHLKNGQSEDSIQEVIQEMDYSFDHDQIIEHEIIDILDTQIVSDSYGDDRVDLYDMDYDLGETEYDDA